MKITATEFQLQLIDRVVDEVAYGKNRDEVLNAIIVEHAKYLLSGGNSYDATEMDFMEVAKPAYGNKRERLVLEPITGKALPVYKGEVLRIVQLEGGQCVDFNAYNLHDYKEYLSCGFNRSQCFSTGKGTIVWTGSPRSRPMYAIMDCSELFDQYFEGHRCNAFSYERRYGFLDHPNCQSTFAETIREYGLTPDDVHTSYNLWMRSTLEQGCRRHHWNRAEKGDYVDFLALFDTLSVPVICGGDMGSVNNFSFAPMEICIFGASQQTLEFVNLIQERFGRYKTQETVQDFKFKDIRAERELKQDPNYRPDFIPAPRKVAFEVAISPETISLLLSLLTTGIYGYSEEMAVIVCFMRWYELNRVKDRFVKLRIVGN